MVRPTKRQIHNKLIGIKSGIQKINQTISTKLAIFICIAAKISYQTFVRISIILNNKIPNRKLFTQQMRKTGRFLYREAQKSANKNFLNIQNKGIVSMDGAWNYKYNSKFCIFDVIDVFKKKIIAFDIINKYKKSRFKNYTGPSNQMEAQGFLKVYPKLRSNKKIIGIVKDHDTTIDSLIKSLKWPIKIIYDPGHLIKNFDTSFRDINKKSGNKLRGLGEKIKKFLKNLLYDKKLTPNIRIQRWENVKNHFNGKHDRCPHNNTVVTKWKYAKNKKALSFLQQVIDLWKPLVANFNRFENTCLNENFHSQKSKFAPKTSFLGDSSLARISASVLEYNGEQWRTKLANALNLSATSKVCVNTLEQYESHIRNANHQKWIKRDQKKINQKKSIQKQIDSKHLKGSHK